MKRGAPHPNSMAARKAIRIPSDHGSPFVNTGFPDDWDESPNVVKLFSHPKGGRSFKTEDAERRAA